MICSKNDLRRMINGDDNTNGIGSRLFGVMMDFAAPIVKAYRSDFYHDALKIQDVLRFLAEDDDGTRTAHLYYGVGECRTHLEKFKSGYGELDYLEITLAFDDDSLIAKITEHPR